MTIVGSVGYEESNTCTAILVSLRYSMHTWSHIYPSKLLRKSESTHGTKIKMLGGKIVFKVKGFFLLVLDHMPLCSLMVENVLTYKVP